MLSQKLGMTGKGDKVEIWDGDEETHLVWDRLASLLARILPYSSPNAINSNAQSFPLILSSETLGRSWRRAICGGLSFVGFQIPQRTLEMPLTSPHISADTLYVPQKGLPLTRCRCCSHFTEIVIQIPVNLCGLELRQCKMALAFRGGCSFRRRKAYDYS